MSTSSVSATAPAALQPLFDRFLDLPRELRDEVYRNLCPSTAIDHPRTVVARKSSFIDLMVANKQIYAETHDMLYSKITITLNHCTGHLCGRLDAKLPTTAILKARQLTINLAFADNNEGYLSELLNPFRPRLAITGSAADDQHHNQKEYLVASLPAELLALTALLRARQSLPIIKLRFDFAESWNREPRAHVASRTLAAPAMAAVLARPLRGLRNVPGGGVRMQFVKVLDGVEGWKEAVEELAKGVKAETAEEGDNKEVSEGETKVLKAHEAYLHAREMYEAGEGEMGAELVLLDAEKEVREWRVQRGMMVREWAREGEE